MQRFNEFLDRWLPAGPLGIVLLFLGFFLPAPVCLWYVARTGHPPAPWVCFLLLIWACFGKAIFSYQGYHRRS